MPVSSGEELNLVILQEQNKRLSRNYSQRVKLEEDLRSRILKLETTLRECEDKNPNEQLAIVNKDLVERNEDLEHQLNRSRLVEARLQNELAELQALNDQYLQQHQQQQHQHQQQLHHHHHHQHQNQHNHNNCTHQNLDTNNSSGNTTNTTAINHDTSSLTNHKTPDDGHDNDTTNHRATHNDTSICGVAPNCCSGLSSSLMSSTASSSHHTPTNMHYPSKLDDLQRKYQDEHELAEGRLRELEKLNEEYRKASILVDKLQQDLKSLPEHVIFNTAEYKTLQSHFSVLWNEATQLKTQLDETKKDLQDSKHEHLKQIERMESEELSLQQQLHNEISNLEDQLAIKAREFDNLKIEHERLVTQNNKLSPENDRLKRQYNQMNIWNNQLRKDLDKLISNGTVKSSNNTSHSLSGSTSVKSSSKSTLDVDTLTHEIEITGQAYDELQEQYQRLQQQLSEKDEANFKLMSERLKANLSQKVMQEKEAAFNVKIENLEKQLERQEALVAAHLNKERLLHENLAVLEKALHTSNQSIEDQRQLAMAAQQLSGEMKLQKEKYSLQLKDLQESLLVKSDSLEQERFKCKRLAEELESWRRKYERAKKFESASTADEVLLEEVREYKEQLTCPSCKTKPKDTVLTKCFHVFCYDCLKARVDTRQRKCPKCNAQFGANDYHRLYLA